MASATVTAPAAAPPPSPLVERARARYEEQAAEIDQYLNEVDDWTESINRIRSDIQSKMLPLAVSAPVDVPLPAGAKPRAADSGGAPGFSQPRSRSDSDGDIFSPPTPPDASLFSEVEDEDDNFCVVEPLRWRQVELPATFVQPPPTPRGTVQPAIKIQAVPAGRGFSASSGLTMTGRGQTLGLCEPPPPSPRCPRPTAELWATAAPL